MQGKVTIRRRVTSGNIRDEAVQEEQLDNLRKNNDLIRDIVMGAVVFAAFIIAAIVVALLR